MQFVTIFLLCELKNHQSWLHIDQRGHVRHGDELSQPFPISDGVLHVQNADLPTQIRILFNQVNMTVSHSNSCFMHLFR